MTDISMAAEKFSKEHANAETKIPRRFFAGFKSNVKAIAADARLRERSGADEIYGESGLLHGAKCSLAALKAEEKMSVCGDVPYSFALAKAYLDAAGDEICGETLRLFVTQISKTHDFKIAELLLLRDFFTAALAEMFVRGDAAQKSRCARAFIGLDALDLDDIFIKFTKVHNILALEKAGVYEKCSRDTILHYDMTLLEMSGGDEIKAARHVLFRADAAGEHVGKYLLRRGGDAGRAYLWLTFVVTACIFAIVASASNAIISLAALVPSYMLAKEITRAVFERSAFFLPSLSIDKATDDERCVVAITTLLCGERSDREIFDNIEDFYLQNADDAFTFAVLGDLRESDRKHAPSDDAVIKYASSRINALNEKYGAHFALFIRRRRFAVCERKYLGWERKRGAVLELCRYINGGDGSFDTVIGGERVRGARFLLTLDSDTKLGISSVREMLGAMLHPQNRPVVDKERGRVVGGYAILQPKMAVSLFSANNSRFAALTGGGGGTDRYSAFSFDLYQDVFGRGIYCGKGMIDVDAFLAVCDGTFPKERILSHDLLEGAIARTAVSGKTVLTDGTPRTATAYFSRLERWIRGDLQTLSYTLGSVKNEAGKKIINPVDPLARYQIFDNIVRESAPLFCVLLVLVCSYFRSYYALFLLAYLLAPLIKSVLWMIFGRERKTLCSVLTSLARASSSAVFEICSLAAHAGTFIKALVNVIYSAVFTKRGFLAWTTAAELESKKRGGLFDHIFELKGSVVFGAIAMTLPLPALAAGALWALFPVAAWALGKSRDTAARISPAAKEKLRIYSADMWKFFSDNVGETTNWLPPDNVQLSPSNAVAMRTSPTNIGLYFLATLAARDFEFIGTDELLLRASNALDSLEKMLRWNGHLYNWYDLKTLNVTGVPFVSSVDSGNFTASLVAFCEGVKEYASENVNLIDVKNRAEKFIRGADFSKLIDKNRGFLSVGYNASSGALSGSCYDMLMSEARTTAYFAESTHAVPEGYYRRLGRTLLSRGVKTGAASWSGTAFEFFMPSLLLPEPKNSFPDAALSYAFSRQMGGAVRVHSNGCKVFGVSESCFFEFDHDMNYQYGAFGIAPLSLDPRVRNEKVVSPYSSFLMLGRAPSRVLSNLEKLKSIGMYGKYGFYEALDAENSRVGNGYAVIKSFMSHHVGMSIVAAANAVFGDIFVERFMRDPLMRSSRELLGERTPFGGGMARKRAKIRSPKTEIPPAGRKAEKKEKLPPTLVSPTCVMLSNNKTRVVLSSSGQMAFFDGSDLMAAAPFEKFSLGGGLSVCAYIDGNYISAVPLGYVSDGVSSTFSFSHADGKATYRSVHVKNGKRVGFDMTVSLAEDAEILTLSCKFTGDVSDGVASVYFEPVIDDGKAYLSHKSFSNLFIESKFFADENALVFRRRPRSDGRSAKYLGVVSSPPFAHGDFDTRRDAVLPQNYSEEDVARLCSAGKGKNQAGADIIPACSVRVKIGSKIRTVSFKIGYSHNCDDLLYILSRGEKTRGGKIYDLQRAASGADDRVAELERLVLGKIMFGSRASRAFGSGIFAALSKKPVYQKNLWRHGISGDRHI
ncbi:MAG: hypothetical protein J5832_03470, partial [Clostridia bacterium]|nr:hypothetical protein [Clostridia bacterium]